ncbi:Meckelin, partial [Blyttiomyces helicus]
QDHERHAGGLPGSSSAPDLADTPPTLPPIQTPARTGYITRAAGEDEWNIQGCEQLGNLCVLQLYDETTVVCQAYERIAETRSSTSESNYDAPQGMPWLYYGLLNHQDASAIAGTVPQLTLDLSSSGAGVSSLPFVLATYALNGTFLGLQNVSAQLQFCPPTPQSSGWLLPGYSYAEQCTVQLFGLASDSLDTVFYDLFLTDDTNTLIPVPVRILNFLSAGVQVNAGGSGTATTGNRLFRRFFLADNAAGTQDGIISALRVATTVTVWITKADSDGSIYIPMVDIEYSERDATLVSDTDASTFSAPAFSFTVHYTMSMSSFYNTMQIVFSLLCIFAGMVAFHRARIWSDRNYAPAEQWDMH